MSRLGNEADRIAAGISSEGAITTTGAMANKQVMGDKGPLWRGISSSLVFPLVPVKREVKYRQSRAYSGLHYLVVSGLWFLYNVQMPIMWHMVYCKSHIVNWILCEYPFEVQTSTDSDVYMLEFIAIIWQSHAISFVLTIMWLLGSCLIIEIKAAP